LIIQLNNNYISSTIKPEGFSDFMDKVFSSLEKEINLVADTFYKYDPEEHLNHYGKDDIFTIIERTWIGLFNNAILRAFPNTATMQEFSVWSETKAVGRCDLLFNYRYNGKEYDVISEAKSYEFTDDWNKTDSLQFYKPILEQAEKYHLLERKYYTRPVVLMIIVFEWIRDTTKLERATSIMKKWTAQSDSETDFVALYTGESRGLFVYGKTKVIDIKSSVT